MTRSGMSLDHTHWSACPNRSTRPLRQVRGAPSRHRATLEEKQPHAAASRRPAARDYDPSMPLRVAMIAAECEPWAKTGGLGDVVDALARSLGRLPGAVDGPVDVFLPRYRSVAVPDGTPPGRRLRIPDPLAPDGATDLRIVDVAANRYQVPPLHHPG